MQTTGQLILLANGTLLDASTGLVPCDGRLLQRQDYPGLFDVIGTIFGSTSSSNFAVPSALPLPSGLVAPAAYYLCTNGDDPSGATYDAYMASVERFAVQVTSSVPTSERPTELTTIPPNCVPCDGRTLQINNDAALYSLLGNSYGGSAPVTFKLPNVTTDTSFYASMPHSGYCIYTSALYPPSPPASLENYYIGQLVLMPRQGSRYQYTLDNDPQGLLPCIGAVVSIQDWAALYELIGNRYGGSVEQGTFALPNVPPPTGLEGHGYYIVSNGMWPSS